jgi:broad-specificity NMP kinase
VDQYKLFSRIDEMGSKVVKLNSLERKINEMIKANSGNSNLMIVGHLVPELALKQDITIVLRISLKELIRRLEARDYQKEKIRENIISESIDYCGIKSKERCKETYEIETDSEKREITKYILGKVHEKAASPPELKEISRFDELLELITNENKYNL